MVDNLINKAEALLAKVKSVGGPALPKNLMNTPNTDFDLSTIDYLLKDIPEAYCEDPQVDDEEIDNILKAGGPLPSQLALPSLYLSNIQTIEKLRNVTKIHISLEHLLIYNAQFGIRKEGSFLIISPPKSYSTDNISIDPIRLDLFELQNERYSNLKSKNDKNESLRNFAVGGVDLKNKKICFDIRIEDQIIQDWLNAKNGISIELYSYLTPLGTKIRGIEPEPVRFAFSNIYLDGLVGSPTLDAVANCILYIDQQTQAKVIGRMQALSFGKKISSLGNKVGVLSMRLGMITKESNSNNIEMSKKQLFQFRNQSFIPPPIIHQNDNPDKFVPEEAPRKETSLFNQNNNKYFGLAVLDIRDLLIPDNIFPELPSLDKCQILILYKLSFKETGLISSKISLIGKEIPYIDISTGKLHKIDRTLWKLPIFEIWIEWKTDDTLHESNKRLVGWSKISQPTNSSEIIELPILNPSLYNPIGALRVAYCSDSDLSNVESVIQKILDNYSSNISQDLYLNAAEIGPKTLKASKPLTPSSNINVADNFKLDESNKAQTPLLPNLQSFVIQEQTPFLPKPSDYLRQSLESTLSQDSLRISKANFDDNFVADSLEFQSNQFVDNIENLIKENPKEIITIQNKEDEKELYNILDHTKKLPIHSDDELIHILDISVEQTFPLFSSVYNLDELFGSYVCYSFPNLSSISPIQLSNIQVSRSNLKKSLPVYSLWWDPQYSFCNGKNRHQFRSKSNGEDICKSLGIDILGGLEVFVVKSDSNGNLPKEAIPIASAVIPSEIIIKSILQNGGDELIKRPLNLLDNNERNAQFFLPLKLSHCLEPILLSKSSNKLEAFPMNSDNESKLTASLLDSTDVNQSSNLTVNNFSDIQTEFLKRSIDFKITSSLVPVPSMETKTEGLDIFIDQISHLIDRFANNNSELFFSITVKQSKLSRFLEDKVFFSRLLEESKDINVHENFNIEIQRTSFPDSKEFPMVSELIVETNSNSLDQLEKTENLTFGSSMVISLYERQSIFPTYIAEELETISSSSHYPPLYIRATDKFIGSAVIDLSVLALGMSIIEGWYHLIDDLQRTIGQIKLKVNLKLSEEVDSIREKLEESFLNPITQSGNLITESELDEPLLNFKSLEYDQLKKLLAELDETKDKMLNGEILNLQNQYTSNQEISSDESFEEKTGYSDDLFEKSSSTISVLTSNSLNPLTKLENNPDSMPKTMTEESNYLSDFESYTKSSYLHVEDHDIVRFEPNNIDDENLDFVSEAELENELQENESILTQLVSSGSLNFDQLHDNDIDAALEDHCMIYDGKESDQDRQYEKNEKGEIEMVVEKKEETLEEAQEKVVVEVEVEDEKEEQQEEQHKERNIEENQEVKEDILQETIQEILQGTEKRKEIKEREEEQEGEEKMGFDETEEGLVSFSPISQSIEIGQEYLTLNITEDKSVHNEIQSIDISKDPQINSKDFQRRPFPDLQKETEKFSLYQSSPEVMDVSCVDGSLNQTDDSIQPLNYFPQNQESSIITTTLASSVLEQSGSMNDLSNISEVLCDPQNEKSFNESPLSSSINSISHSVISEENQNTIHFDPKDDVSTASYSNLSNTSPKIPLKFSVEDQFMLNESKSNSDSESSSSHHTMRNNLNLFQQTLKHIQSKVSKLPSKHKGQNNKDRVQIDSINEETQRISKIMLGTNNPKS